MLNIALRLYMTFRFHIFERKWCYNYSVYTFRVTAYSSNLSTSNQLNALFFIAYFYLLNIAFTDTNSKKKRKLIFFASKICLSDFISVPLSTFFLTIKFVTKFKMV